MYYLRQHIKTIIENYDGKLPLAHFLKNYYKRHPKLGSRDRRQLTEWAYTWYRYSKGWKDHPLEKWLDDADKFSGYPLDKDRLFPYAIELSAGMPKEGWLASMLAQPRLFIRMRKNKDKIIHILEKEAIPFDPINDQCLSLPNGAKIDALLPADSYVVQDASSQLTGSFFKPKPGEHWYDCCSGAGGKSLLLKDLESAVLLTVTDKRESIIHNLLERFGQYHMTTPDAFVTDVADAGKLAKTLGNQRFDNIICDAPCSGSGTWARTPEQLYFFDPAALEKFYALQRAIAINATKYLKPGGRLLYITCSVFRQENEDVVAAIEKETGLTTKHKQIINGIELHADSMFIAELQ